jgi:hypothetical protein
MLGILIAVAGLALQAPALVSNPTLVVFTCPDHDQDTGHEIDIVEASTGRVVQTLQIGDPPADAAGDVAVTINVQPIKFGAFWFKVRATADTAGGVVKSADSKESDLWSRVPGAPGAVRAGK